MIKSYVRKRVYQEAFRAFSIADIKAFFQVIGRLLISEKEYLGIIEELSLLKIVHPISSHKLN